MPTHPRNGQIKVHITNIEISTEAWRIPSLKIWADTCPVALNIFPEPELSDADTDAFTAWVSEALEKLFSGDVEDFTAMFWEIGPK